MIRRRIIGITAAGALAAGAVAMTTTDMDVTWAKMAGGGATFSTGEQYVMGSTIGQPDATAPEALRGGRYALTGGFWVADTVGGEVCEGDQNGDGVIDVIDILVILNNWGPCPPPPGDCPGDANGDGVVDFGDIVFILDDWGCGAPEESATFDQTLDLARVRGPDWDVFERLLQDGTSALADNWRCWMTRRLEALEDDFGGLPDCPGDDPLE